MCEFTFFRQDFVYGQQKWNVSFVRSDRHLGSFLKLTTPSQGLRCRLDFSFTIVNREHFTKVRKSNLFFLDPSSPSSTNHTPIIPRRLHHYLTGSEKNRNQNMIGLFFLNIWVAVSDQNLTGLMFSSYLSSSQWLRFNGTNKVIISNHKIIVRFTFQDTRHIIAEEHWKKSWSWISWEMGEESLTIVKRVKLYSNLIQAYKRESLIVLDYQQRGLDFGGHW